RRLSHTGPHPRVGACSAGGVGWPLAPDQGPARVIWYVPMVAVAVARLSIDGKTKSQVTGLFRYMLCYHGGRADFVRAMRCRGGDAAAGSTAPLLLDTVPRRGVPGSPPTPGRADVAAPMGAACGQRPRHARSPIAFGHC